MNKVMYVGVGVYVNWTRLVLVRPACSHAVFIVLAHTTPRVSSDVLTQAIILTPGGPDGL